MTKERRTSVRDKGKSNGKQKPLPRAAYSVSAGAMKSGMGRKSNVPRGGRGGGCWHGVPGARPAPCSSSHSRTSSSDTALTASSCSTCGTRLPMSVDERKPSTTRLHLPSASRSRTFHRSFHLPVSFFTSAHSIFCCGFHSGHSLKR